MSPSKSLVMVPLGASEERALPWSLRPAAGATSVLLLAEDPGGKVSYLRRLDAEGTLQPIRTLVGRHLVTALDLPTPQLITSDGQALCVEPAQDSGKPTCKKLRGHFIVLVDGVPMAVEQRIERPPDDAKSKIAKRRRKRRRKSKTRKERTTKMRVWLHPLGAAQAMSEAAIDTQLVFPRALPNLGVVAAKGSAQGVRLLWYEHRRSRKVSGKFTRQAALRSARLDRHGKLVPASLETLYSGPRTLRNIEGHSQLQLVSEGGRSALLERITTKVGKTKSSHWVKRTLGGSRKSAPAASVMVRLKPQRLLDPQPVTNAELASVKALEQLKPQLSPEQPLTALGRIAWLPTHVGYFLSGDRLMRHDETSQASQSLPAPFLASRSRIHWGTWTPQGEGLARTATSLVEVHFDHSIVHHDPGGPALEKPLQPPVRVGASWWALLPAARPGSGAQVSRLTPAPMHLKSLSQRAYPDSSALVGGLAEGMFLALRGGDLEIWQLRADGQTRPLATQRIAIRRDFSATRRGSGGALMVGLADDGTTSVIAIDARGALGPVHTNSLHLEPGGLRMRALPLGGAIIWPQGGERISWVDDQGRELSSRSWPTLHNGAPCLDGEPARSWLPEQRAGQLQQRPAAASDGICALEHASLLADGSRRWFGSRVDGLHSTGAVFFLPGGEAQRAPAAPSAMPPASASLPMARVRRTQAAPCPRDMVFINGSHCIDRYESQLVDAQTGLPLSPDFPLGGRFAMLAQRTWSSRRLLVGDLHAQAMPLPALLRAPGTKATPLARSRRGVRPSGYLSGHGARRACEAVGKRLCSHPEWVTACRGEQGQRFPYGDRYRHKQCNVHRAAHPAATLHDNPALGHLDPRLNRVALAGQPLLRRTGTTPTCLSRWGDDAVHDMVGNLDEWVNTKTGAFAGGFYARASRRGCDTLITVHPRRYLDYSLGVRCCQDAAPWARTERP